MKIPMTIPTPYMKPIKIHSDWHYNWYGGRSVPGSGLFQIEGVMYVMPLEVCNTLNIPLDKSQPETQNEDTHHDTHREDTHNNTPK
jgi:hypothetical protein